MARYLGWTIPFVSLNGTSCRIDIYDEDYHGSATTLQGADNPIEWNESDDDDLLSVVRTKTGYIRVIEENYGDLNALYPKTDTEKFVVFYYGGYVYFTGYMQALAFNADWRQEPRVIEFPIQSPLAVAKGLHLSQPSDLFVSVGNLLYDACQKLNAGVYGADITNIILPESIYIPSSGQYSTPFDVTWRMSSLVCCPFNPDFSRAYGSDDNLYEPLTVYDFIEGLCNCLGLMVYDMPGYLIFRRIDYSGWYKSWVVSTLDGVSPSGSRYGYGGSTIDHNSAPILSNNNKEVEVRPLKKLEIDYEGDFFEQQGAAFEHARLYNPVGQNSNFATLEPVGVEVESNYLLTNMSGYGVWMGGYGKQMRACFIVFTNPYWSAGLEILRLRYMIPPKNGGFRITIPIKQGANFDEGGYVKIGIMVKNSSYYYDASEGQHTWRTSSSGIINAVTRMDGTNDLKLSVDVAVPVANRPLEIIITNEDVASGDYLIEDVTVDAGPTPSETFAQNADTKKKLVLKPSVDNGSNKEASISLLFNVAIKNKSMLLPADANGYRDGGVPATYDYMFDAQRILTADTFIAKDPSLYLGLVSFHGETWRIRSISFIPWDDQMRISFLTLI